MKTMQHMIKPVLCLAALLCWSPFSFASSKSCFADIKYTAPAETRATRGLYILIDETAPLSDAMKTKLEMLVQDWGEPGDLVKIARFSASYRDLYPELLFSQKVEAKPDDAFMYNLVYKDREMIKECLMQQQMAFKEAFPKAMKEALKNINPKIPKSELLGSLKQISKKLVVPDEALEKIVLLVSDGLENSSVTSFYGKGIVRKIEPSKEVSRLRRMGMLGYWKDTRVYMYGLGLMPDKKRYSDPARIVDLKQFWERYFAEGGGKVKEIGTPELLLTAID